MNFAHTASIAFRNLFRNARRSSITVLSVATGGIAVLMFGGFVSNIFHSLETGLVMGGGHLQVFKQGYFHFGAGDPASYGIPNYEEVMKTIETDPQLGPMVTIATPQLALFGVAGNFKEGVSRTFLGIGFIPSDRRKMAQWDRYDMHIPVRLSGMSDDQLETGIVGEGLARVLHLCEPLHVKNCPQAPKKAEQTSTVDTDIQSLANLETQPAATASQDDGHPKIDLLAATAQGAPNIVSLSVLTAQNQGFKEMDEIFVGLPLGLAQKLIYGRGEKQVTSVVVQLKDTDSLEQAVSRLNHIFVEKNWGLEVRTFHDLTPFYDQATGMFRSIFAFLAVLMGAIVLFTVINTMSMVVMERTVEIGTIRALGLRRNAVRLLFVVEGALLGMVGASLGVVSAIVLATLVNASHMTWLPPNNVERIPLNVNVTSNPQLIVWTWIFLVLIATLSAFFPANRAAKLTVVNALHQV
jgi:putative ABC transport system permease protein